MPWAFSMTAVDVARVGLHRRHVGGGKSVSVELEQGKDINVLRELARSAMKRRGLHVSVVGRRTGLASSSGYERARPRPKPTRPRLRRSLPPHESQAISPPQPTAGTPKRTKQGS